MGITEAHFLRDLIIFKACLPEELLCPLHTDSGKHFREGPACGLLEDAAETAGTDVQIVTDMIQSQILIAVIFSDIVHRLTRQAFRARLPGSVNRIHPPGRIFPDQLHRLVQVPCICYTGYI